MILVTGSSGKTGRSVLQALAKRDVEVRALVHRSDQETLIRSLGAREVICGDMRSPQVIQQAVAGVQAIYHIPPNMHPDEVAIGQFVIEAALVAGISHFVYHSVLKPQVQAMPHHWNKMRVEEMLITSQLPYTILQPAAYMQNILANWDSILQTGEYPVPYPASTRLSLVDLADVAQAAAIVLTEKDHHFAIYELAGTIGISQSEVADILSEELQRKVQVRSIPLNEWEKQAHASGLGNYQVETLVKMFRYYQEYGFEGNPRVLTWLLGRPPQSIQDFIRTRQQSTPLADRTTVR
jgi:NAD(P)H dehydrogenase (quinone)